MDPKQEFQRIGNFHDTDKTTHHGYHRFYHRYLKHLQLVDNMSMIEIGIHKYKSLNMWLEYFPKAFIYGLDINCSGDGNRYMIYKCDQSDIKALEGLHQYIIEKGSQIHFINDDGSHVPEHMIITFNYMFTHVLLPGGTYIIEDIETSYWKNTTLYGHTIQCGYGKKNSVVEIFKKLVDDINREFLSPADRETQKQSVPEIQEITKSMISSITFGHNCIIIMKKDNDEYDFVRDYRFAGYVQ
jgi:hypothetical protein